MIRAPVVLLLCAAMGIAALPARSHQRGTQDAIGADVRALLATGEYERAEALARANVDALHRAQGDDALDVAVASDLLVRALVLNGRGASASTLTLAELTLRRKTAQLGPAHPELASSLINVGDTLVLGAEYGRGLAALERAVALRESSTGPRRLDLAVALDHLGSALTAAGRYGDALRILERSLSIRESMLEKTDVRIARTLEAIGWALQRQGDYDRAGSRVRRAAAIQEAADATHPDCAVALNLLGLQFWFEGHLTEARDTAARAVAVAERTLRPDHPTTTRALRYLAGVVFDLGDPDQALWIGERALASAERNFGADHHETGAYLNDAGYGQLMVGAYTDARVRFERALKIAEARFGPWHDRVANAVVNLADVDASLGDYASARRGHARAVAIWQRVFGPDHPFVALALAERATAYREEGAPARALPLLERALAIRERRLGQHHRDVAVTLADLAATLMQVGRAARAQTLAARALRIWERLGTPDAPDLATVFVLYAELQANRGDGASARQYYEKALAIREKVFGRSHPTSAEAEAGLALALASAGNAAPALVRAANAEATGRNHLRLMLRYLPERQALNYAASRPRGLDLALSLVGAVPDAPAIAMDGLIRGRALVLDQMAARRAGVRSESGDAGRLRAALGSAQQRLANLVVRGPGDLPPARYAALLDEARRDSERAERTLAEQSAVFSAELNRSQLGLDQVEASLPAGSALVSFVRYDRSQPNASTGRTLSGTALGARRTASYLAFVLRPREQPIAVRLGPASSIDPLVHQWRQAIAGETQTAARRPLAEPSSRASGAALRRLVWDPLTAHLNDASRIFIVPDGALGLVPFVALPIGRRAYLIEHAPPIHYLSAERDIVSAPGEPRPAGRGLLAIGGPAFDDRASLRGGTRPRAMPAGSVASQTATTRSAQDACDSVQTLRFPPLSGTRHEVQEVARLWQSPSPGSEIEAARVLVGRQASERAFKDEAPNYRVLHIATHGFFLGDRCSEPRSGTRAAGGLTTLSGRRPPPRRSSNPLLLSGLALAGANRRASASAAEDEGILTADEVASLNLGGVELAVLSACDTGVGEVKAGEGVFGLRRAFQIAGARTVVMSLWSVDDQATRAWMRALYDGRFQHGLPTADAVHAASLAMLRQRRAKTVSTHPFYWAAFVAVGDWR